MKLRPTFGRPLTAVAAIGAVAAATVAVAPMAQAIPAEAPTAPAVAAPAATGDKGAGDVVRKAADGKYIVQLDAAAAPTYQGDVSGLAATAAGDGRSFDASSAEVDAYAAHLDAQRAEVLRAAGVDSASVYYEYDLALAGFAADLSYDEATQLAATPGVRSVEPNELRSLDTSNSPDFLGLTDEGGLWEQLGGQVGVGGAGEDIVIGVVDGGFSPTAGSFAPLDGLDPLDVPDGWQGTCDPGDPDDRGGGGLTVPNEDQPEEAQIECQDVGGGVSIFNNKVIAARFFVEGFGTPNPGEFVSPKDYGGHGSHTASTSGGNGPVDVEIAGNSLGQISGMAPRARIASYKVCYQVPAGGSCATSDSIAAIETGISDGVDVFNYSISGSLTSAVDGVAIAYFNAAAAGIYVSVSAGNSGPTSTTVAHNYPWVNTTAASTQDRRYDVAVIGEDDNQWTGSGIGAAAPESPSVYAANAVADGADPADAALCFPDTLDPDVVNGQIVVCDRGVNARVEKSQVVGAAGGVGMVLANDAASGTSVNAERHSVPTAHVSFAVGVEIKEYVGVETDNDVTLELGASEEITGDAVTAPEMAAFSSRGPGQVAGGDLLKPDITAPGVDILAAYAPSEPNFGEQYAFISGTSMSSPHMAGIGALMRDFYGPAVSPMAIESALITTAYQQNNQGNPIQALDPATGQLVAATPFNYGGGHVDPNPAAAVAAVYDSGPDDWLSFLCGNPGGYDPEDPECDGVEPIDGSDLNRASIAIGGLAGTQTVTRTLTNITDTELSLTSTVDVDGISAVVEPAELTIATGASADFTVTFTSDGAEADTYTFGSLTWTDTGGDSPDLRSPVAIQPVGITGADELLVGEGSTGSETDTITSSIEGTIDVELGGLEAPTVDIETLTNPNTTFPDPPVERDDIYEIVFDVPEGAHLAHFALYEDDYVSGTDLDLYLYIERAGGELELVDLSATGIAGESLLVEEPEPGTYHAFVHLWALAPGETEVEAIHHAWAVTDNDVDDFTVDPASLDATIGSEHDVTFSWTDLAGPEGEGDQPSDNLARYLGKADYVNADTDEEYARTVVRVDVGEGGGEPGPSWELLDTGSDENFAGLDPVSPDVAWLSSDSGTVLRTTDGGATFEDVSPADTEGLLLRDVEAKNADEAMVLSVGPGEDGRVYRTVDGGATWVETFRSDEEASFYNCIAMSNNRVGIAVSDPVDGKFRVIRTTDSGATWAIVDDASMPDALAGEFNFAASGTCATAAGNDIWFGTGAAAEARVFHSGDFGLTWEVATTPIQSSPSGGIFSLDFRTSKLGFAIGGDFLTPDSAVDALARTTDNGATWQLVDAADAPDGYRSGSAWFADRRGDTREQITDEQKIAFVVGPSGSDVTYDRGKTWEQFDDGPFNSVECVKLTDSCWAAGPDGRVATLVME